MPQRIAAFVIKNQVPIMKAAGMACSGLGMVLTSVATNKQQKIDMVNAVKEEVKNIANQ